MDRADDERRRLVVRAGDEQRLAVDLGQAIGDVPGPERADDVELARARSSCGTRSGRLDDLREAAGDVVRAAARAAEVARVEDLRRRLVLGVNSRARPPRACAASPARPAAGRREAGWPPTPTGPGMLRGVGDDEGPKARPGGRARAPSPACRPRTGRGRRSGRRCPRCRVGSSSSALNSCGDQRSAGASGRWRALPQPNWSYSTQARPVAREVGDRLAVVVGRTGTAVQDHQRGRPAAGRSSPTIRYQVSRPSAHVSCATPPPRRPERAPSVLRGRGPSCSASAAGVLCPARGLRHRSDWPLTCSLSSSPMLRP